MDEEEVGLVDQPSLGVARTELQAFLTIKHSSSLDPLSLHL